MAKKKLNVDGEKFRQSLVDVAKDLDKLPQDVTKADYANSTIKGTLVEWELRKLGGFGALKNIYFPPEHNIVVQSASKVIKAHRNKIESTYGKEIFFKEEFLAVFKDVLKENPIKLHQPVKPIKKTATKISRAVVAHFSDTHFGCNIDKQEMAGANEFNWTVAARRTAFFMDQIVTYKPQYREQTELFILLNGDIIAGVIHDQEWAVDLLTTQFAGTLSIFGQAISYAAQHYGKVTVVCTPGNHGRAMHKTNKGRASVHKWDSYENMIYIALRAMLSEKHKNINFIIPESPYATFKVQGHMFLQTHGDTVINVGNPGKNLNMDSINEQINKVNSQLLPGEQNFAAIVVGHVHVATVQLTDSGTMLLINGTLSGVDAFAQSIGIMSNNPTQTLFEVVPGHAVGDIRIIQLKEADKKAELDNIVKPFEGKF